MTIGLDTIKFNQPMSANQLKAGAAGAAGAGGRGGEEAATSHRDRFEEASQNFSNACYRFARRHPFGSTLAARAVRDTALVTLGSAIVLGVPTAIIAGPGAAINVVKASAYLGGVLGTIDGITNGLENDSHIKNGYGKYLTWPCTRPR